MDKKILARLIMVVCLITGIGQVAFANPGDPWTEIFESVISQDDVAVEPPQKKVLKSLFFVPRAVSNKIAAPAIAEDKVTVDADQDDEKPLAVADEKKQTDDLESYAKELEKKSFLTPHFRVAYATRFECRWTDAGSGASLDVGVWRPICPPGWVRLHHVFVPSTSSVIQPTEPCILVKWDDKNPAGDEKGPYLKKMTGNEWMWDDKGAGSITHGSFWYPKPPPGYVTLGSIGKSWHAHAKFDSLFRCVREDLVLPGKYIGQIYNDTNSGATKPVSVWSISVADGIKEPFLFTSAAHIAPSRSGKPTIKPYVLKALSPDAAFEATKKGVLSAHWKAMVERTQIEIGEVRKAEKEALDKQVSLFGRLYSSELKIPAINLAGGAENFFQIKPVNDSLPSKPFSEKDFAMIAASIQEGNGLQLEKLPQFDRFPILKGATLDNLSVQQGKFADGDEAGQPWLSVSGDAKISFPRFGSVNGRLCFLSRLYKQKGLKSGLFISVPAEVIEKSFGDVARPLFKQLSFSENAFVTYAADEHEWKINEFPAEIRENLASLSLGEDAGLPFAMGESCWLVAEVKESPVLAAPMAFLQSQPPRLLLSAFIPSDRDQDSLLRANLQSRFLPGLLPGGKSLDVAPPVLELQFGKSRKLTFSSELTLKPTSKIEFSIPVQIEFPANGKTAKSISVSGKIAGKWNDAFGIRGLEIENPTISGAFGENPSLGLAGIVDFGEGWKFDVAGAFTATTGLAALRGKLDRDISFNDIVMLQKLLLQKAYPGNKKLADVIPASSLPLQELKLKNPEFCISQIDDTAL
ncbi:MAG: Vps62-related protein, partial [Candidatus Rifleibacteriota bacterium]